MKLNLRLSVFPTSLYWLLGLSLVACGPPRGPQATGAQPTRATTAAALTTSSVPQPRAETIEVGQEDAQEQQTALAAISGDVDPAQRRAAIDRYANRRGDAEPLLRGLSDRDPMVRRWAALALERQAKPTLAPALRQALVGERDPAVENILQRALARASQGKTQ